MIDVPPRFAYWTILAGGLPTAFRATERDELMPTFQRLREKHPDAEMKWFARGKLWNSPDEARASREERPRREQREGDADTRRGRDWRPGGSHRDPRQKFADAKKARNGRQRQARFDRKNGPGRTHGANPKTGGDRPAREAASRDRNDRFTPRPPRAPQARDRRDGFAATPPRHDSRPARPPKQDWRDRPRPDRPRDQFGDRDSSRDRRPVTARPPRQEWRDRPPRNPEKPGGHSSRPGGFQPRSPGGRPRDRRSSDWRDRPPAAKSAFDRKPYDARGNRPPTPRDDWKDRPGDRPRAPKADWRDRPRGKAAGNRPPATRDSDRRRPFDKSGFNRNRAEDERPPASSQPPRPQGPNREPRPSEHPSPTPPPRPSEPAINPPGPPERGKHRGPRRR